MNKTIQDKIYKKKYTLDKGLEKKVVSIVVNGCNGHMGGVLCKSIDKRKNCRVCAGIDIIKAAEQPFPVFSTFSELNVENDVIIDFSHPDSLDAILKFAIVNRRPLVLCTTGYSRGQIDKIESAAKEIPIFFSGNMSLGINLLIELSKVATKALGTKFDIEIVEKHHNQKIDAPSGTALMLADEISSCLDDNINYTFDRYSKREKRAQNEIGIHSVRGGTIVGEHDVIFAGPNEIITLSHSAQSKEVFAEGAINAALFLLDKEPGLYDMKDMFSR